MSYLKITLIVLMTLTLSAQGAYGKSKESQMKEELKECELNCLEIIERSDAYIHDLRVSIARRDTYIKDLEVETSQLQRALDAEIDKNRSWYKNPGVTTPLGFAIGVLLMGFVGAQ